MAQNASLVAEEWLLVEQCQVVEELDVVTLRSVADLKIPRVDDCLRTAGLGRRTGSHRATPGEIGSGCQVVPVPCGEAEKRRVVIAPYIAGGKFVGSQLRVDRSSCRSRSSQQCA